MKRLSWLFVPVLGVMFALPAMAQDKKDDKKPADAGKKDAPAADNKSQPGKDAKPGMPAMSPEEMKQMEAMVKAMMPGPEHEKLKPLAGSWTYTMKHRHGGEAAPWQEATGTIERRWVMGNRHMIEEIKGPSMMPGAPPFEGTGVLGHDNAQKKYWLSWYDNYSTGNWNMTGTADASGKVFTFTGDNFNPMLGKPVKSRSVLTIKDDKTHVLQFFEPGPDGKEYMNMELTATKK